MFASDRIYFHRIFFIAKKMSALSKRNWSHLKVTYRNKRWWRFPIVDGRDPLIWLKEMSLWKKTSISWVRRINSYMYSNERRLPKVDGSDPLMELNVISLESKPISNQIKSNSNPKRLLLLHPQNNTGYLSPDSAIAYKWIKFDRFPNELGKVPVSLLW